MRSCVAESGFEPRQSSFCIYFPKLKQCNPSYNFPHMLIYQMIIPCRLGSSRSLISYQLSNWFSLLSREVPSSPSDVGPLFSGYWFFFLGLPHCFKGSHPSEDFLRKMYIDRKYQKMFVFYLANTVSVFTTFRILDHLYGACFSPFLETFTIFLKVYSSCVFSHLLCWVLSRPFQSGHSCFSGPENVLVIFLLTFFFSFVFYC